MNERQIYLCEGADGALLGYGDTRDEAINSAIENTNSDNSSELYLKYSATVTLYGPVKETKQGGVW